MYLAEERMRRPFPEQDSIGEYFKMAQKKVCDKEVKMQIPRLFLPFLLFGSMEYDGCNNMMF